MRALYTLLLYLLLPVLLLRAVWRGWRSTAGGERPWERLGFVVADARAPVVVHCVSVGETVAAVPLLNALMARGLPLWVTSTTLTGAARVRTLFGDRVRHSFLPVDTPGAVSRFLDRARPRTMLVMETEIWPNLIAACKKRGIPVVLVNGRLSERSARGYARLDGFTRQVLDGFARVLAQADADAGRFRALGAPSVIVTGNLKFDLDPPGDLVPRAAELRAGWGARPVWIAASTHEADDTEVLRAHQALLARDPSLLLLLVPRHPERFDAVAASVARAGLSCARRSRGEPVTTSVQVYLADTMGELPLLYAASDVAFVGGSFSGTGGHNLLEPVALRLPVVTGPSLFNFQAVSDALRERDALDVVADGAALAGAVGALLVDPEARRARAGRGQAFVAENRGALGRALDALAPFL